MEVSESEKYRKAKKKVTELKSFYWHLAIFIIVNSYIFVSVYIDTSNKGESFWHYTTFITFFFWGIGLLIHGWHALWKDYFFTREWEQKQIQRYIKKDVQQEKRWE
ncbi:2TM domain-containing protein [Galbibacter pacificus]|uniref:2TM domain-containing protein n=1 Tax=Galbibacter pacificus TaxID=2996052 RepID=A0ABT6FP54_9FLAO|nr:2TM domain-containing protein [Galbibacter pacificus]MDG3581567.1 2TM domain-containing protein [Galbibacter pacificus]MDG3585045.1 2TM domain-containing protein [Galbibacter pacificus]